MPLGGYSKTLVGDHLKITNTGLVNNLKANDIDAPIIHQILADIEQIKNDYTKMRKEINELNTFCFGDTTNVLSEAVQCRVHLDDVVLDSTTAADFKQNILEQIANLAGVEPGNVVIIDMIASGSATVQFEVRFDEGVNSPIDMAEKKTLFLDAMQNPDLLAETFTGPVQLEEIGTSLIKSIQAQVSQIKRQFAAEHIQFEAAKSINISDYRIMVEDTGILRILKYDNSIGGVWVGGEIALDPY